MIFAAVNGVELAVFIFLFGLVTVLGFVAARWRAAKALDSLDEWGLGGRSFGSWITWFLLGGDLYTAYTFVAVPALLFGAGALGFFAVPYTIIVFPMVFLVAPRLWSVSHRHGYVTPADFIRGRFGSGSLALMIAITGIVATMPYIALQLIGIEAVLKAMGILGHWPIIIAFGVLAAYTYQSGLRAPALIAFVKDSLIYLVVLVAVIYIPTQLGGFDDIFAAADEKFTASENPGDGILLGDAAVLGYSTLAFGSALALFLYPHSVTGVLAARSRDTIKRNMAALPAYSIMLGLLALLGYMAIAAGIEPIVTDGKPDPNTIVPLLFDDMFPSWFAGHRVRGDRDRRAGAGGDHVDRRGQPLDAQHLQGVPQPRRHAGAGGALEQARLAGGQGGRGDRDPRARPAVLDRPAADRRRDHPADAAGDRVRPLHDVLPRLGLLAGWATGLAAGMYMLYDTPNAVTGKTHFGGPQYALSNFGFDTKVVIYTGLVALLVNIAVCALVTFALRAAKRPYGEDADRAVGLRRRGGRPGRRAAGAATAPH